MASRELGANDSPPREKELWLLGFRIKVAGPGEEEREAEDDGSMRKSWSMGDLATPVPVGLEEATRDCGYLSEGGLYQPATKNGRKRGIPWTEEEHRTFLKGLEKLGKGDWRGISRNFVRTRTPTQVASHAQKYFLRQMNPHKRKRRFSLFDVAMDNNDQVLTAHPAFSSRSIPRINEKEQFAQDDATLGDQVLLFSSHEVSPSRKKMMIGSCSSIDRHNINCKVEATSSAQVQATIESKLLPPIQAVRSSEKPVEGTSNASLQPSMHRPNILEPTVSKIQRKFVEKDASFLQCSDLELRIGLPQPNLAARLPSPSASGAVGVS